LCGCRKGPGLTDRREFREDRRNKKAEKKGVPDEKPAVTGKFRKKGGGRPAFRGIVARLRKRKEKAEP